MTPSGTPGPAAPVARRRLLVVYNPTAGARRPDLLRRVLERLAGAGCEATVRATAGRGDAERLARAAGPADGDALAVAGGDGTINEALNGLGAAAPPLGIVPLGTANVLAAEIGLDGDDAAIARTLLHGGTAQVLPGLVDARRFLLMAGVGFDAHVVRDVDPALKRRLGKAAYVLQTLRQFARYPFPRFAVSIGGQNREAASLVVARSRFYGGRFVLAPLAGLTAPALQACLFTRFGRGAALGYAAALPLGLMARHPGIELRPTCGLDVEGPAGEPVQADGDIVGRLPARIGLAATPVRLLLPPGR